MKTVARQDGPNRRGRQIVDFVAISICMLLLACVSIGCIIFYKYRVAVGSLVFEEVDHDFGNIAPGSELEWTFHFRNLSWQKVRVKSVHASCGCVVPSFESSAVGFAGEGSIDVRLSTAGRAAPTALRQTVRVEFEDPSLGTIELGLQAAVQPFVTVNPDPFVLAGSSDHRARLEIRPGSIGLKQFKDLRVAASQGNVNAEVIERHDDLIVAEISSLRNEGSARLGQVHVLGSLSRNGAKEIVLANVDVRRDGAILSPSGYFVAIDENTNLQELPALTRQCFALKGGAGETIIDVETPKDCGLRVEIDKSGTSFAAWLEVAPVSKNLSLEMTLAYMTADAAVSRRQKMHVPVRIVGK